MTTTVRDLLKQALREAVLALSLEDFVALKRRYSEESSEEPDPHPVSANNESRSVPLESS